MKGTLVASVLALAFTVAFASSSADKGYPCSSSANVDVRNSCMSSTDGKKFAPRFDGLRFIETLITGHR